MSNIIPPLLSSTPPPIIDNFEEEDDDEFGDFRTAGDLSTCDSLSIPPTPEDSPFKKATPSHDVDINSNSNIDTKAFDYEDILEITIKKEDLKGNEDSVIVTTNTNPTVEELNCTNEIESNKLSEDEFTITKTTESQSILQQSEPVVENDIKFEINSGQEESINDTEINAVPEEQSSNNCKQKDNFEGAIQQIVQTINHLEESKFEIINDQGGGVENLESSTCDEFKICDNNDNLDDDFGDFAFSESTPTVQSQNPAVIEDEFTDFNEFNTAENETEPFSKVEEDIKEEIPTDDFGDFASPSDFGDFSCNFPQEEKVVNVPLTSKEVVEKCEVIIKDMFPPVTEGDENDSMYIDLIKENSLFNELKDVTETKALSYQWSKSSSQKSLLKSLNIDERNILYGPSWNLSVPRFAATLSAAPLEPVKSDAILTPTPVIPPNTTVPQEEKENYGSSLPDIPTAQFDWNGSGLTNPLDYNQTTLLDLEHLVQSLDIPKSGSQSASNNSSSPVDELDDWEFWLKSQLAKEPSSTTGDLMQETLQTIKNLHEEKLQLEEKPEDKAQISPGTSTAQLDNVSVKSLHFQENQPEENETNIEFTSFQSSQPPPATEPWQNMVPLRETYISNDTEPTKQQTIEPVAWLQPTILTPVLAKKELAPPEDDDDFDDFQIAASVSENTQELNEEPAKNVPNTSVVIKESNVDDGFSSFQSGAPQITQPLQPVTLEPLKPLVSNTSLFKSTQINWPDPGITDDDIRNIELSYSHSNNKTEDEGAGKSEVNDDDEWSDFVSVQEPPKTCGVFNSKERISTPDLPLSVLNLGNVQPTKTPIPVITPRGLIQTQLPSTPIQTKVVQTSVSSQVYKPVSNMQTSTITQQFMGQLYNNNNNTQLKTTNLPNSSKTEDDDDDWSDFVSAPPTMANGVSQNKQQATGWATPHIITNPSHFESLRAFKAPSSDNVVKNKKVINVQSRKSTVPSISAMPDLDFIAPKRTSSRK